MSAGRSSLLAKVEALARLTGSDKVHEAFSAGERAVDLIARYDISANQISADALTALEPFSASLWLSAIGGRFSRWAALVGEDAGLWHVTGAGVVDAAHMIALAEGLGYRRLGR